MNKVLVLLVFILFHCSVFAAKNIERPSGEEIILASKIDDIKKDLDRLVVFQDEIRKRESQIYEFKIRFSELVTSFSSSGVYNNQFQSDRQQLEQLEFSVAAWKVETSQQIDRTKEFGIVLDQLYGSLLGKKKQSEKKEKSQYNQYLRDTERVIEDLKKYQAELVKHDKFLEKFLQDTARWKNFLLARIKSSLDSGIMRWNLNRFFIEPIFTLLSLQKDFMTSFSAPAVPIDEVIKFNVAPFIGRLFLSIIVFGLILGLIRILRHWALNDQVVHHNRSFIRMIEIICQYPRSLAMTSFLLISLGDWGAFTYQTGVGAILYLFSVVLFSFVWLRVFGPVLMLFIGVLREYNTRQTFIIRSFPIYLYIVLKSFTYYFAIDNDLLTLITSALLGWISFKFFTLILFLRFTANEQTSEKWKIFFKVVKILLIIFTAALLLSAIAQFIGFYNLGTAIQSVIGTNAVLLVAGWALFQLYTLFLDNLLHRFAGNRRYQYLSDLFRFLRNNGAFVFTVIGGVFLLESWYQAIYVFGDFWKSSLFDAGDYHFTFDRIIDIFFLYYLFRISYLVVLYFVDRYVFKQSTSARSASSNYFVIVRYLFIVVFIFVAAGVLGFTYKNLLILASALGVGIGFGLQNIVNNFISGIILLFERPIRVGDIIEVDGVTCHVKQIGIRSTIVETPDNSTIILPNSDILSNKLINWTLNGNMIAIRCEVGVAYGSDTRFVTDLLQGVICRHPDILNFPVPQVWFTQFGDSSLNFVIKAWINKPDDRTSIRSDLLHMINQKFSESGIEIPFPQREIHIKSGSLA